MNSLSWTLYAADIAPNVGMLFISIGIAGSISSLASYISLTILSGYDPITYSYQRERDEDSRKNRRSALTSIARMSRRFLYLTVPLLMLGLAAPSKQTIYLIAGSQISEIAVNSQDAKEIYGLIKNKLTEILAPHTNAP